MKITCSPQSGMWRETLLSPDCANTPENGHGQAPDIKLMLDRIPDWETYLSSNVHGDKTKPICRHYRTGRPLGSIKFIKSLELKTGKTLTPKRPGPKPLSTN